MLPSLPTAVAMTMMMGGCTVTVHPPLAPEHPVDVFIIDYGRHSSLLLPETHGTLLIEFTYGDWNWFALERDDPLDIFPTLFLPTQGTLGRWEWNVEPRVDSLKWAIPSERIHPVTVSGEAVAALLDRLETRFRTKLQTQRESELYQLVFVHDDRPYSLLNHCIHTTRQWLEELGCQTSGMALVADFRIAGE